MNGCCPECGKPLPPDAPGGLCAACLVKQAMGDRAENSATPPITDESLFAANPFPRAFGNYELLEEIARGGMGVVYKARQKSLNRVVALKMILAGHFASKQTILRFRAEAEAAANLHHPNIVAIHETGEAEGQHYFSMDYVEGSNLAQVIYDLRFTIYDFKRCARWVRAIAEAVQYAHGQGVLHRDLKPSNVLIDGNDEPRITDFGLAKKLVETRFTASHPSSENARDAVERVPIDLTATGQLLGSPGYMPPEQASSQRGAYGLHSDVYAVGAILYHLLTGRPPFQAENLTDTLEQLLHREPVPPRQLNLSVPPDLETICLKCLEKEPVKRYATARQVAEELARFLSDQPIMARPVSRTERVWRWGRRNPALAAAIFGGVMIFFAGFAGVVWQWRRAEHHARTETQQRERLEEALTQHELEKVEELFSADDAPSALARLARVLHRDPANRVAATRLLSALTQRNFALPVTLPLTHEASVSSAQFSRDGRQVVTAAEDGAVRVWDARSGQRLLDLTRHGADARHAEFSPSGRMVATASDDGTARIWDAHTGQPITGPLQHGPPRGQHGARVRRIHFNPDGTRVVTASADATARLWETRTGLQVTPALPHTDYVNEAEFSPDGQSIVTASDDDSACVWDAGTGRRLSALMQHRADVRTARFSPEGKRIVTASGDYTARVWNALTGEPLTPALVHKAAVVFASFSPDGTKVVTASWDDTARVWNAVTGEAVTPPLQFESDVLYAEFSPDGRRVFTIADALARIWDAQTGLPVTEPMLHGAPLRHIGGFSFEGERAVTASLDKTAMIWDVRSGAALPAMLSGGDAQHALARSPDGRLVAAGAAQNSVVKVWNVSTGEIVAGPFPHPGQVERIHFSVIGQHLATACRDGHARLWDLRTGQLAAPPLPHQEGLRCAQFSLDGRRIVTASDDDTARIWDVATGRELARPLRHRNDVQWAEFSANGRTVLTASGDATARVWDAATGQPLTPPLVHELLLRSAHFSPDGRWLLTASEDGTARLWEAASGESVGRSLTHRGHVRSAEFSADGQWVVTASADKTARVWDTRTGEPVTEPLKHDAPLQTACFSPDGTRVATVSAETVRIWDAKSGHLLFEPLRHQSVVNGAVFVADGKQLATVSADGSLRLWPIPTLPLPVPDWLPELAEALAAKRLDLHGRTASVAANRLVELRRRFDSSTDTNFYAHWAKWFLADRTTRAVSPFTPKTEVGPQTNDDRRR